MSNSIRQRPNRVCENSLDMTEMVFLGQSTSGCLPPPHGQAESEEYNEATVLHSAAANQADFPNTTVDDHDSNFISIDDAIDRIGMGKFQTQIMVAAGLCFAADAMEILLLSFLSLVLLVEWGLTDRQASSITASVFAGSFVGTLTLGRLGDRIGRKPIFIFTASMIAFFGVGTSFVQHYNELIFFRFMVGFGVGGITVPFDMLAEFMPTQSRGQRLVTTSYFWTTATMLVPLLAYATLGTDQSTNDADASADSNWRLFVACCAIPCVVSAIWGMYVVPESPRWLLLRGEADRALEILRRAAITNGKDPSIVFPTGVQLIPQQESESATFCDLLSAEWYRTTLILWCLWGCYAFLYYGTIIAVSLVFLKAPESQDATAGDKKHYYHFDYLGMIVSSSAEVAGVTWVWITVDRFGRINCMTAYFFLGGLFILALCLLEGTQSTFPDKDHHRLELILLAFFSRMFVYSGSSIVWIVTAELLTTKIRATGHSVANAFARVGAFLAPFLVSTSQKPSNIGITMFLASILIVICVRSLPETAGQPLGSNNLKRAQRIRVSTEESI